MHSRALGVRLRARREQGCQTACPRPAQLSVLTCAHVCTVTCAPLTHISPLPETQLGCRPALRVLPQDRRPVHLPSHPHLALPKAQPSQGAPTPLAACLRDNSGRQLLCNCSLVSGFWPLELGESVPAVLDYPASGMCRGNQQGVWKRTQVLPLKETSLSGRRDGTLLRARVPPLKETSVSVEREGILTRACPSPQGDHSVRRDAH